MVALSTVADSSPTPKPRSSAWVARLPVILLQNAYRRTDDKMSLQVYQVLCYINFVLMQNASRIFVTITL